MHFPLTRPHSWLASTIDQSTMDVSDNVAPSNYPPILLETVVAYLSKVKKQADLEALNPTTKGKTHPWMLCTCDDEVAKLYVRRVSDTGAFWGCANYGNGNKGCGTLGNREEFRLLQALKQALSIRYNVTFGPAGKKDDDAETLVEDGEDKPVKRAALPSTPEARAIFGSVTEKLVRHSGTTPVNHAAPLFQPKNETFVEELIQLAAKDFTPVPPEYSANTKPPLPKTATWFELRHLANQPKPGEPPAKAPKPKILPTVDLKLVHPAKNCLDEAIQFAANCCNAQHVIHCNAFTSMSHFVHATLITPDYQAIGVTVLPPHDQGRLCMFQPEELDSSVAQWLLVPTPKDHWSIINLPKFRAILNQFVAELPVQYVGTRIQRDDKQNHTTHIHLDDLFKDQDISAWLHPQVKALRQDATVAAKKQVRKQTGVEYHDSHSDQLYCGTTCRPPIPDQELNDMVDATLEGVHFDNAAVAIQQSPAVFAKACFTDPNQFSDPGQTAYHHIVIRLLHFLAFAQQHELLV